MKVLMILTIVLASCTFAWGDSCSAHIIHDTDEVTGDVFVSTDMIYLQNNLSQDVVYLYFMKHNPVGFSLQIKLIDRQCIDKSALINILFTDGSRLAIMANSEFNCNGRCPIYFGKGFGRNDEIKQLSTKRVKTIRIATYDGYEQVDLTANQQEKFYIHSNCIQSIP